MGTGNKSMLGKLLVKSSEQSNSLDLVTKPRIGMNSSNLRISYKKQIKQGLDSPSKSMLGNYLRKTREQDITQE